MYDTLESHQTQLDAVAYLDLKCLKLLSYSRKDLFFKVDFEQNDKICVLMTKYNAEILIMQ